jgi:hypothetical protein
VPLNSGVLSDVVVYDDAAFPPSTKRLGGLAPGGELLWSVALSKRVGGLDPHGAVTWNDDVLVFAGDRSSMAALWLDPKTGALKRELRW